MLGRVINKCIIIDSEGKEMYKCIITMDRFTMGANLGNLQLQQPNNAAWAWQKNEKNYSAKMAITLSLKSHVRKYGIAKSSEFNFLFSKILVFCD